MEDFIELYKKYSQKDAKNFENELKYPIIIENEISFMTTCLKNFSIIPIRQYKEESTLIVGCGNKKKYLFENFTHIDAFHNHEKEYTIDNTIFSNPSTVANFEKLGFPHIPDESFSTIIFEKENASLDNKDFLRIMKNNGVFYKRQQNGDLKIFAIRFSHNSCRFF